jgi:penicillin-binding protein 1C
MPLPEPDPTCQSLSRSKSLQIIYPYPNSKVYIPRELDGSEGKIIFEAALNNPLSPVFWHIDGELTHTTTNEHKFPVHLSKGQHNLMVMDNEGNMDEIYFQVLEGGYGK